MDGAEPVLVQALEKLIETRRLHDAEKRIRDNNPLANTARSRDWCVHNSVSSLTSSLNAPTIGIMKL
jgi:hypothetical protein